MGVRKKIIHSNRMLIKNGNLIVMDNTGKKHRRFNRRSAPNQTEIYERERFRLTIHHAIAINVVLIIILILTFLSK